MGMELADSLIFGKVIALDDNQLQFVEDSIVGTFDTILISISNVNRLFICPRKNHENCDNWLANLPRNEIMMKKFVLGLSLASILSIYLKSDHAFKLSFSFLAAAGVTFTVFSMRNDLDRIRLNKKWKPLIEG